jgi:hypothetical protein
VDSADQIIVAHEATDAANDKQQVVPMVEHIRENLGRKPKRDNMQKTDQFFMTHDRLVPDPKGDQLWCIKGDPGKWQAVSIPATTQLSPMLAKDRAQILGRQEAIKSNPMISTARADFLVKRLAYWDEWVRRGAEGPISADACE